MIVYLDNCRTTKLDETVFKEMKSYFTEIYGVPSGVYTLSEKANDAVEKAQMKIGIPINANPQDIIFTSGATESNNIAIKGIAFANKKRGNHIITTKIEHPSVINSCKYLENNGFKIDYLDVDKDGFIDIEELKNKISKKTILVSVQHVNDMIGTIQPIEKIGKILKNKNIYFHVDAASSFGKLPINVKKMNIDLLSISSHMIHGPKGIGALYVKQGTKIEPLMHGFESLSNLRPGDENVPGIIGFAKAAEIAYNEMEKNKKYVTKLRDRLIDSIEKEIPNSFLIGPRKNRSPYNITVSLKNVEGEAIALQLDMQGVAASTGSACVSKTLEANYVLLALGLKHEQAHGSIRFCLSKYNTIKDIDYAVKALKKAYNNILKISMFK